MLVNVAAVHADDGDAVIIIITVTLSTITFTPALINCTQKAERRSNASAKKSATADLVKSRATETRMDLMDDRALSGISWVEM
jgi:hypothetical protein